MIFSSYPKYLQLIFASACGLFLCVAALGQDKVVMQDGEVREGEIVGASAASVNLKVKEGTIGVPKNRIRSVEMQEPSGLKDAVAAWESGDAAKALAGLRPVVEKFKGLPTDWAQLATGMLGDIYVSTGDMNNAEKAYQEFLQLYPGTGAIGAEVGMARIAFSKKDLKTANEKLNPVLEGALNKPGVSRLEGAVYGQAFLLAGEIKESEGDLSAALENYLRTVTLFYQDAKSVQLAEQKANEIRKNATVHVP